MGSCDWCGKGGNLNYVAMESGKFFLCKDCREKLAKSICRKCGEHYDIGIRGMCLGCAQVDTAKTEKIRNEKSLGVDTESLDDITTDREFTDEDYNNWVTFGQGNFSPDNRKENRRNWIIAKLLSDGYNEDSIKKNLRDIEEIININFSDLLNNKAKIVIEPNLHKNEIRNKVIIARLNKVYLIEVTND